MKTSPAEQLTLSLSSKPQFSFEQFYVSPSHQEVMGQLRQFLSQSELGYAYLTGAKGTGKSHLLQASCQWAIQNHIPAMYLPLAIVKNYSPTVFENLEHYRLVAIDDIQLLAGIPRWEEALFHLFNRIAVTGQRLLLSGEVAVKMLPIALPDLASRLSSGLHLRLVPLTEEEIKVVFQQKAQQLGLFVSEEVVDFLLKRVQRDMSTLAQVLTRLDQASLAEKQKLTIPFVKRILML